MDPAFFALLVGCIGMLVVSLLSWSVLRFDAGTERMRQIAAYIREGANAFIKREGGTILYFMIGLAALFYIFLGWEMALSFIIGSLMSMLTILIGMNVSVRVNVRTANAARTSLNKAMLIALWGGAGTGLTLVATSLMGIAGLYYLFGANPELTPRLLVGFGVGASLSALFAQLGGGIYTKAADIGADLVGKVEVGIPEDDPRNPAVIADQVGDNVGDCAGRGADLFESFSDEIIAVMILGIAFIGIYGVNAVLFPLATQTVALIASIISVLLVIPLAMKVVRNPMLAVNLAYTSAAIMTAIGFYLLSVHLMQDLALFYSALLGIGLGFTVALMAQYYTSPRGRPVRRIAEAAGGGAAINIMTGFSYGLASSFPPILAVAIVIMLSYLIRGAYGVAAATLGVLSLTGIVMTTDAFGPIVDNADGIAEMSGIASEIKGVGEQLDAVGNTTKALTKGYAMACACLAGVTIILAYLEEAHLTVIDLANPVSLVGLFIGASIPFIFSAFTILAVSRTAHSIVGEVRRQFHEIEGLREGRAEPDYSTCIDICTRSALKGMILPTIIAAASPIVTGFLLGGEALGAFLVGVTAVAALLAFSMFTAGGALDNAKKFIESGFLGGKGTPAHAAAVTGDTYGDPLKDTAGPSLHIVIKLVSIIALAIAPLLLL